MDYSEIISIFSIMNFIIGLLLFGSIFLVGHNYDKININLNRDYLDEYSQCKEELKRTQPICPVCKCSADTPYSIIIFSFIFGAGLMLSFYDYVIFPRLMKSRLNKYDLKNGKRI